MIRYFYLEEPTNEGKATFPFYLPQISTNKSKLGLLIKSKLNYLPKAAELQIKVNLIISTDYGVG